MRVSWRNDRAQLLSHAEWHARLDRKNRRQGTSAPTLAAVWAGPVDLYGALHQQPALTGLVIDEVLVERQSSVDDFSGPRNHDLVLRGHLPNREGVVVCVEAKAGEDFGPTVARQAKVAAAAKAKADDAARPGKLKTSNASARLEGLLKRFVRYPVAEQRVQDLRYQLLTALAGTVSEAKGHGAHHAVLMVHEFLTDQRDDEGIIEEHEQDLGNFCTTVFDVEPPGRQQTPWCVEVPDETRGVRLYLARAITDLRALTLESKAAGA